MRRVMVREVTLRGVTYSERGDSKSGVMVREMVDREQCSCERED